MLYYCSKLLWVFKKQVTHLKQHLIKSSLYRKYYVNSPFSISIICGSGSYGMLYDLAISITYFSTNNFGGLCIDSLCFSLGLMDSTDSTLHASAKLGPYLDASKSAITLIS